MAGLRGEWPCLPFGPARRVPENLPTSWQARTLEKRLGSWLLLESCLGSGQAHGLDAVLAITLPEDDPVERLERHIRAKADVPAIEVELVIHPRRDAVIPLRYTDLRRTEGVELVGGGYSAVHTYPMPPEPGVSRLRRVSSPQHSRRSGRRWCNARRDPPAAAVQDRGTARLPSASRRCPALRRAGAPTCCSTGIQHTCPTPCSDQQRRPFARALGWLALRAGYRAG